MLIKCAASQVYDSIFASIFKILMNVLVKVTTAILMLPVATPLVASPVPVTRDILEMERGVGVSMQVTQ